MAKGKVEEITLPVAGMSCAACVNKVEKVLKGLPGVAAAKVNCAAAQGAERRAPPPADSADLVAELKAQRERLDQLIARAEEKASE